MQPTITLITKPWFFDVSLELIKELKKHVVLNVVITVSPRDTGYLGITALEEIKLKKVFRPDEYFSPSMQKHIESYIHGVNVICKYEEVKETSVKNILSWKELFKKNKSVGKSDAYILESLVLSDLYLLFKIRNKKIFYVVHDPLPHTGEKNYRYIFLQKLFFPRVYRFITYSLFSTELFKKFQEKYRNKVFEMKLPIYFNQKFDLKVEKTDKRKIVFFGRISPYKGVEYFYAAAAALTEKYNDVQFIIAGKSRPGYQPDFLDNNKYNNIIIYNQYIDHVLLNNIMDHALLCVLPYTDATQSGVTMTSYAFNVPVLVSDCEGLLEYCFDRENFSFENGNVQDLQLKIERLINNDAILQSYRAKIDEYKTENVSLGNVGLLLKNLNQPNVAQMPLTT